MEENKLTIKYYKQNYDNISGDEFYENESKELAGCGLMGYEIDDNFHIINGEHIKNVSMCQDVDNKKRLKFTKNNKEEMLSDAITLNAVDVTTSSTIKTSGGPLSELFEKNGISFPDINPNTDLQTLLHLLFSKELWGEGEIVEPYLITKYTFPDVKLEGNLFEVGTNVLIPEIIISNENVSVSGAEGKYVGFEYGYSTSNNNTKEGNIPPNIKFLGDTPTPDPSKQHNVLVKLNDEIIGSGVARTLDNNIILPSKIFNVKYGDNIIDYEFTGPSSQQKVQPTQKYYICSNFKNTSEEHIIPAREEKIITSIIYKPGIKQDIVMGDYKYFIGAFSDTPYAEKIYTSDSIRIDDLLYEEWLSETKTTKEYEIIIPSGTRGLYISLPKILKENFVIEAYQKSGAHSDLNIFRTDFQSNTRETEIKCGGESNEKYEIYTWDFPQGIIESEIFLIKIYKK